MSLSKKIKKKLFKKRYLLKREWHSLSLEMHVKKNDLLKGNFDTIVLGSSHAQFGFYTKYYSDTCYNLSTSSQDLYYTKQLFDFCNTNLKSVKHFIIFYSVFSPGFILQLTSIYEWSVLFKLHYNFAYNFQGVKNKELDWKKNFLRKFLKESEKKEKLQNIFKHYNGFTPVSFFSWDGSVIERAAAHLKHNKRPDKQNFFIEEIYNNLKYGQKLTIVIPPARADYKFAIKESYNELFKDIILLCEKLDIELLNFYETDSFNDYFFDTDHLDPVGAYHLTTAIKNISGEQVCVRPPE